LLPEFQVRVHKIKLDEKYISYETGEIRKLVYERNAIIQKDDKRNSIDTLKI
jgi:hypothetical protein